MIRFIRHRTTIDLEVGHRHLPKRTEILKVLFDEKDVHTSRSGQRHLDIWGAKLKELDRSARKADRIRSGK